jgi:hypothetical protein
VEHLLLKAATTVATDQGEFEAVISGGQDPGSEIQEADVGRAAGITAGDLALAMPVVA